jgi:hypothetical protein
MTKKSRTAHQQRARQEQWQRRVQAQIGGTSAAPAVASSTALEDEIDETIADGSAGYQQAEMRQMPANVSTSGASTKSMNRSTGAATMPSAGQRRAIAATRASRAKIAMNTMSLEEEMRYVRADIRKLVILTTFCLAIIILLAIAINFL